MCRPTATADAERSNGNATSTKLEEDDAAASFECPEVNYPQVMQVVQSWDDVKQIPNYEATLGEIIFLKFLEIEPDAADPLDLGIDLQDETADMKSDPRFKFL